MSTKRNGKRRPAAVLIAASAVLTLAACGAPGAPSAGKTDDGKLVFSTWQLDEAGVGDFWHEAIDAYNAENPELPIEVRSQPSTGYWDQLLVELQGPTPPDIIHVSGFNLHEIAAMGAIEPIDELATDEGWSDRINETALEFATIDESLMGYPVSGRTMELIYNERLLTEAGFDGPPTTPTEFLEYARALTITDGNSVTQYGAIMPGGDDRYTYEAVLYWALAHGGNLASDGQPTLTDPGTIAGVEFMQQMYQEMVVPQGVPYPDQRQLLAQGLAAMAIDGSWLFPLIESTNAAGLGDFKTARVPWESGIATGGPMQILAVGANSAQSEQANKFIAMVSLPEWQQKYFAMSGTIPYGEGVVTPDAWADKPWMEAYIDSLPTAEPIPPRGMEADYSTFSAAVQRAVSGEVLLRGADAAEALKAVQDN